MNTEFQWVSRHPYTDEDLGEQADELHRYARSRGANLRVTSQVHEQNVDEMMRRGQPSERDQSAVDRDLRTVKPVAARSIQLKGNAEASASARGSSSGRARADPGRDRGSDERDSGRGTRNRPKTPEVDRGRAASRAQADHSRGRIAGRDPSSGKGSARTRSRSATQRHQGQKGKKGGKGRYVMTQEDKIRQRDRIRCIPDDGGAPDLMTARAGQIITQ